MNNLKEINILMLKKENRVVIDPADYAPEYNRIKPGVVLGAMANLARCGYIFDEDTVMEMFKLSEDDFIKNYYNPMINVISDRSGDLNDFDKMPFQHFPYTCERLDPQDFTKMNFSKYYVSVINKIAGAELMDEAEDRTTNEKVSTVQSTNMEYFYELNKKIMNSKSMLSTLDNKIIESSITNKKIPNEKIRPNGISNKDALNVVLHCDMESKEGLNIEFRSYHDFKKTLAVLSGSDPSDKKAHLRKFTRDEKLYLLKKLEDAAVKNPELVKAQMVTDKNYVKNLGAYWKTNKLPQDIKNTIPNVVDLFDKIYHGEIKDTINTRMGNALRAKDSMSLLDQVKDQPTELFKRLYFMLDCAKNDQETQKILDAAAAKAYQVPNEVLLKARNQIMNSQKVSIIKTAYTDKNKMHAMEFQNKRGPLSDSVIKAVDQICINAVAQRLSGKLNVSDKKIYISPDMKKCPIPFDRKNCGIRTLAEGTKFKVQRNEEKELEKDLLGEKKGEYLRVFVDKMNRTKKLVWFSTTFMNDKFEWTQKDYTSVRDFDKAMIIHSPKTTNCINGVSEYVDIDLKRLADYANKQGIRYVAFNVFSCYQYPFSKFELCQIGAMSVDRMTSYSEMKTDMSGHEFIRDKIDLSGDRRFSIPFIYDIETKEMTVCDISLSDFFRKLKYAYAEEEKDYDYYDEKHHKNELMKYAERYGVRYEDVKDIPTLVSCNAITTNVIREIMEEEKPNLYDLYLAAAVAGGAKAENFVSNKDEADISFDWEGNITPYDIDSILNTFCVVEPEYLGEENKRENVNYYEAFCQLKEMELNNEIEK